MWWTLSDAINSGKEFCFKIVDSKIKGRDIFDLVWVEEGKVMSLTNTFSELQRAGRKVTYKELLSRGFNPNSFLYASLKKDRYLMEKLAPEAFMVGFEEVDLEGGLDA